MENRKWVSGLLWAVVVFWGGLMTGVSLSLYFGLSPRPPLPTTSVPDQSAAVPRQPADAAAFAKSTGAPPAAPAAAPSGKGDAPVVHYTVGERAPYRLDARITGEGAELLTSSDIAMDFAADFSLLTESVDDAGNATMLVTWDALDLGGTYWGSEVQLNKSASGITFQMDGKDQLAPAQAGDTSPPLPLPDFLQVPTRIKVAPDGRVLDLQSTQKQSGMLAMLPALSGMEAPPPSLENGEQWESEFTLPLPGFGGKAGARVLNTVIDHQYIGDRLCTVIHQNYSPLAGQGDSPTPTSPLDAAASPPAPPFALEGESLVWYDAQKGQLVDTQLDLTLRLDTSRLLRGISGSLGELGDNISQLLSKPLGDIQQLLGDSFGPSPNSTDLDIAVRIQGTMALGDVVQP